MTFGKSRVQYNDFYWQYYRFPKFDVYFYVHGNKLAEYTAKIATEEMQQLEYSLEEILQRRIIFIIYNKQSEFRQSNIGLISGNEDSNIGGVTRIVDNKVFVYYEGDHNKLREQIRASITEILLNEMLYGGNFRDRVSSSAMLNLPEWFLPGLISYEAHDLDYQVEAKIKNGMLTGKYQKIHRLHGKDATLAGHAFWRYLSETYGDEIVSQIIYMTRISKNVESGFLYVLGMPMKEVLNDWFYYYQGRYADEIKSRDDIPEDSRPIVKRAKKKKVYNQVKMSPDGKYIAYTTNQDGQYKIFVFNTVTGKTKRLFKKENKLEQITDYSYPVLAWHPSSEALTYMYERKGQIWFDLNLLETGEIQHREMFYLDKVLDYSYSPDGSELVISGILDGYTDIFTFSMVASTFNRITNDITDDMHPRFIDNASRIIFSSDRRTTKLNFEKGENAEIQKSFDLFIYDGHESPDELIRVTDTYNDDELNPVEYKRDKYFYLSDHNGIFNQAFAAFDSAISFIDTSIHYRTFTKTYPITNRSFSINQFDYNVNTRTFSDIVQKPKRFSMFTYALNPKSRPDSDQFQDTWFKQYAIEKEQNDSLWRNQSEEDYKPDSIMLTEQINQFRDTLINIDNYVFELEKKPYIFQNDTTEDDSRIFKLPKQLVYFTNFYSNLLVTQVDFGFMSQSYQAFTGSAFYYNPGFNVLTKVGAIDLFEDYKITGGIRFSADFQSNEYLLSIEDLKYRFDRQYIFHRQVFENSDNNFYYKVYSNEVMALFKYPISQIQAFRTTVMARNDQKVYKSIDYVSLEKKNEYQVWGGLKLEYILDNTRSLGLNLYDGTRMKVFSEYYNQLGKGINSNLIVLGADIRNYLPIHRDFILASRFATSTSLGNSLLIYYLGGVDNWMNFSRTTSTFDNSTRINQNKNWVYQAVATNMRGFIQNVRNGNSFAVVNTELRLPIIRYLFNRPISNDFLNNFMVIGFADGGSAWEGWNPLKAKNAYDYETIENGPITVIIDKKKSPFVAGVGFGLRSRFLGYYVRTDWAWGIDSGRMLPRVFYLSLCTDF